MLILEKSLKLENILSNTNLAEDLPDCDRTAIAMYVYSNWTIDRDSRLEWEKRMADAMELAMQVSKTKTFPWPNCSNVKFPIVTIAALQFHARAYSALLPGPDVVKCEVFGADPDGIASARATRVSEHMSYQVLEEDVSWEEVHDRVLITVPIMGCSFKKVYFDADLSYNVSEFVPAKDLYIPYYAQSLELASRKTQITYPSRNSVISRERSGIFLKGSCTTDPQQMGLTSAMRDSQDKIQGSSENPDDPSRPFEILEQHCWLDLDGDDYEEPYIVSVRKDTQQLCRIVARFKASNVQKNSRGDIISIHADEHFIKYGFIPSPDGGIYDLGWGSLLGPLNESINTSINQLSDAGTLSNTSGGFLGRGARIRSGNVSLKPFEWTHVDVSGDNLRNNIVPATFKEPSAVLFNLLQLLIQYAERVAGVTDAQVGVSPGQNTPAETTRTVVSEGQKVFFGILKRLYRSMKQEFRLRYKLNRLFLNEQSRYFSPISRKTLTILAADYLDSDSTIYPAADPSMLTDGQRVQQAQLLKQSAISTPGYDLDEVERHFLQAIRVRDIAKLFPGSGKVPQQPHYRIQIEQMRSQSDLQKTKLNLQLEALKLLGEADLNQAKISQLNAQATALLAQANSEEANRQIAIINAQIGAARAHQDTLLRAAEILQRSIQADKEHQLAKSESTGNGGRVSSVAPSSSNGAVQSVLAGIAGGSPEPMG